jgi:tRNA (cmo5U34)-methyltransferase
MCPNVIPMEDKDAKDVNKWVLPEHVSLYLNRSKKLPHTEEAENALLEQLPTDAKRILDLGTGYGRLLALAKSKNPQAEGVGVDFSEPMLNLARERFAEDKSVKILKHDLSVPLPTVQLGCFDVVVSGLAIHHLVHERKRQLYGEIFDVLNSGGVFCNFEHVSSPTTALHEKFLAKVGLTPITDDPSNKLLDVETQLGWLREIGFVDVDCCWKWLEVALLVGFKP